MQRLVFVEAGAPPRREKSSENATFLNFVYSGTYHSPAPSSNIVLRGSSSERAGTGGDYKEDAYAVEWSVKPTPKVTQEEKDETARLHPNSRIDGREKEEEAPATPSTTTKRPAVDPEPEEDPEQKPKRKPKKRKGEGKSSKKATAQGSTAARNRAEATKVIEDPEQVQKALVEASSSQ